MKQTKYIYEPSIKDLRNKFEYTTLWGAHLNSKKIWTISPLLVRHSGISPQTAGSTTCHWGHQERVKCFQKQRQCQTPDEAIQDQP